MKESSKYSLTFNISKSFKNFLFHCGIICLQWNDAVLSISFNQFWQRHIKAQNIPITCETFCAHFTSPNPSDGEGNGTPLQYSGLENAMDGGVWWAAVHGVAKSRTRLSDATFTFSFHALEKEMATHSSVLAWRIPGTGEPGGLPSMGSHRVRHDWSYLAAAAAF